MGQELTEIGKIFDLLLPCVYGCVHSHWVDALLLDVCVVTGCVCVVTGCVSPGVCCHWVCVLSLGVYCLWVGVLSLGV